MSQPVPPQRELVFCHECENEWYRDENGIICPECQSDFTECIEPDHDPREEILAPDPDEDDIGQFEWTGNAAGENPGGHLHGHIQRTFTLGPGQLQGGGGGAGGGIFGAFSPVIQGVIRSALSAYPQTPPGAEADAAGNADEARTATGSPQPDQQQRGSGRTLSGSGPGFAYTITTNSTLHPRDANMAQPIQTETADIGTMMQRMIASMGVAPVHGPAGHPPAGMGAMQPMSIEDVLAMFGGAGLRGMNGDAVHSQQDFDRIMTQLAEQHAAEQAPPRASDEAIAALPRRQIDHGDFGETGQAECSICIGKVEMGEEVTVLPCKHWFHHECVKPWLESHDTCPHCRKGIMPKDDASGNMPRNPEQAPHHDLNSQGAPQPPMRSMLDRMREAFGPGPGNAPTGSGGNAGNDATGAHPGNEG